MACLKEQKTIQADELSKALQVSLVTVRKDLQRLEDEGKLIRTFGGAAACAEDQQRYQRLCAARVIAEQAAREIKDGDCVILNAGNTTLTTAHNLLQKRNLKVITNSVLIAREFSRHKDIQLIFLGGEMNASAIFTHGRDAIEQLEQYKANKLILSVNGISYSKGLTTRHMEAADLFRKMIERSQEVIVTVDSSKIGFESFYHVCGLEAVTKIITNTWEESEEELRKMEQRGIEVCRCG